MNKNKEKLVSFIEYCLERPEERFWQALRNWSKYDFIFAWRPKKPIKLGDDGNREVVDGFEEIRKISELGLEDTFYWE